MSMPRLLASLLALGLVISTAAAQAPTTTAAKKKTKAKPTAATAAADSQPAPAASTTPAPVETAAAPSAAAAQPADTSSAASGTESKKKHHGLFGKVKDVAGNKIVQSVAKTAACTMVPGGQAIAGAIDAGSSHNATGAAAGAAGAATGSSCYGAMGGPMGGAMGGMGPMGGAANAAMAAQQQAMMAQQQQAMMAQQQQAMQMQQQQAMMMQQAMAHRAPGGAAPPMGDPMAQAAAMGMMPDDQTAAACMGLTVQEYHLLIDPPPVPETKAYMKAHAAVGKKIDQAKQRECAMQTGNQMMATAMQGKAEVETKIANSRAAGVTEAPGQTIELASDPTAELKKGKTALRNIDWVAGSTDVSEAGKQPFDDAMTKLAAALRQTGGGQYRIDLYMDQRYDETAVSMFGPARIAEVHAALSSAGVSPAILLIGKPKRDKNPRLELVKVK